MPSISADTVNNVLIKSFGVYVGIVQPIGTYLGARDTFRWQTHANPGNDYLSTMVVTGSTLVGGLAGMFMAPISVPIHFYRRWSQGREDS